MIKERKDFYTLVKMKSECKKNNKMFWHKSEKTNIIVDLSELDSTWINDGNLKTIKDDLIKEVCQSAISDTVLLSLYRITKTVVQCLLIWILPERVYTTVQENGYTYINS